MLCQIMILPPKHKCARGSKLSYISHYKMVHTAESPSQQQQQQIKEYKSCYHHIKNDVITKAPIITPTKIKPTTACLHQHSLKQVDCPYQLLFELVNCHVFLTTKIMPTFFKAATQPKQQTRQPKQNW